MKRRPATYLLWTPNSANEKWLQQLMTCALWLGPQAVVSHRASGFLWEVEGFLKAPLEFSTLGRRGSRVKDLLIYRVSYLPDDHVTYRKGFRVTSIARTLVDLASVLRPTLLEMALESALRRSLTTVGRINEVLSATNEKQRGRATLRRLLKQYPGTPTGSAQEVRFWQLLRSSDLPLPVRQFKVRNEEGEVVVRPDMAYPDARLAIEVDGFDPRSRKRGFIKDRAKSNLYPRLGWEAFHVTSDDVDYRPGQILMELAAALDRRLRERRDV